MLISPVKYQPYGINIEYILPKRACHTHLKHSNPYTFILQKLNKPSDILCTHIFFASEIILIFSGVFVHRISRILKVNLKWIRVTAIDFSRQKHITRGGNPKSEKPSWKARNEPPKCHTKNRPFVYCTISKDRICSILSSRVKSSDHILFYSYVSTDIVDNYENSHILSEEYMFTDNI